MINNLLSDNQRQHLADEITAILRSYRVAKHYKASKRMAHYAVFTGALPNIEQVTEPSIHADAIRCREGLIVSDLIDLIEGLAVKEGTPK